MTSTLKNHPIWNNLAQTLKQIIPNQIAIQHLQACNAQINGYWDEEDFYEVISFTQIPHPEMISSSLGISPVGTENSHWLQLKFALTINISNGLESLNHETKTTLGELILLLDENLEIIDENWLIDVNSPYIIARQ